MLNYLVKRLLSEINGHLITLRAILNCNSSTNIEENFIFSGGYISTEEFKHMLQRLANRGFSNLQPFPPCHILSRRTGLSTSTYTHANENPFFRCVSAYIDHEAYIRDATQAAQMKRTDNKRSSKYESSDVSTIFDILWKCG